MTARNLDIGHGLEVLERLKQTVAEYAMREERMTRGLEARRSGVAWRYQAGINGSEQAEAEALAELDQTFGEKEARVRGVASEREAWVRRASAQELRNVPRKAREARGNWLANLQLRLRQAEAVRAERLHAAAAEAAAVAEALTLECERVIALKREARKDLPGYSKLARQMEGVVDAPGGAEGLRLVSEAIADAQDRLAAYKKFAAPGLLQFARPEVKRAAQAAEEAVVKADRIYETVRQLGAEAHDAAQHAIQDEYEKLHADISEQWTRVDEIETRYQAKGSAKIEKQTPRLLARVRELGRRKAASLTAARQQRVTELRTAYAAQREEAVRKYEAEHQRWSEEEVAEWRTLEQQWAAAIFPIYADIRQVLSDGKALCRKTRGWRCRDWGNSRCRWR